MRELTTLANYKVNEGKLDDWEKRVQYDRYLPVNPMAMCIK
jgi:hypothetical protein